MKPECVKSTKQKIITFSEKRSKLILINQGQVKATRVIVDGCEIIEGIKCDFLLIAKEIEHYIELKGQDIDHALAQIKATINLLSTDTKHCKKISYIICTRSPYSSASIQNLQVKFKKDYNCTLLIKSSPFESSF